MDKLAKYIIIAGITAAVIFLGWYFRTILLYLAVAVIYSGTVLGFIRTKWLLPPLFGLPFLYHIFVEDLAKLRDAAAAGA